MVNHGADTSWCGSEICSPNPIIFQGVGGVVASYGKLTGFISNSFSLEEKVKLLNEDQLKKTWEVLEPIYNSYNS